MTLAIDHDPTRILHDGKYLPMRGLQAGIMAKLIERGRAPFETLHVNPESLKVIICLMRRKLPPEVKINSLHGWGYELSEGNK